MQQLQRREVWRISSLIKQRHVVDTNYFYLSLAVTEQKQNTNDPRSKSKSEAHEKKRERGRAMAGKYNESEVLSYHLAMITDSFFGINRSISPPSSSSGYSAHMFAERRKKRESKRNMRKYEFHIFSPTTRSLTLKKRRGKKRKERMRIGFSRQSRKIMMTTKKEKFKKRERELQV